MFVSPRTCRDRNIFYGHDREKPAGTLPGQHLHIYTTYMYICNELWSKLVMLYCLVSLLHIPPSFFTLLAAPHSPSPSPLSLSLPLSLTHIVCVQVYLPQRILQRCGAVLANESHPLHQSLERTFERLSYQALTPSDFRSGPLWSTCSGQSVLISEVS